MSNLNFLELAINSLASSSVILRSVLPSRIQAPFGIPSDL